MTGGDGRRRAEKRARIGETGEAPTPGSLGHLVHATKKEHIRKNVKAGTLGELVHNNTGRGVGEENKKKKKGKVEKQSEKKEEEKSPPLFDPVEKEKKDNELQRLTERDFLALNDEWEGKEEEAGPRWAGPSLTAVPTNVVGVEGWYDQLPDGDWESSARCRAVLARFEQEVLGECARGRERQPLLPPTPPPSMHTRCKCGHDSSSEDDDDDEAESDPEETNPEKMGEEKRNAVVTAREIDRKRTHPAALSPDVCFNEKDWANDGPVCRCSWQARQHGIRHNKFAGETRIDECDAHRGNVSRVHHYVLNVWPNPRDECARCESAIVWSGERYVLEGVGVLLHRRLPPAMPDGPSSKWTHEYATRLEAEAALPCYTMAELEAFSRYVVFDVLDLVDVSMRAFGETSGCPIYHILPRYTRVVNGVRVMAPMHAVLQHYINVFTRPLVTPDMASWNREAMHRLSAQYKNQLVMNVDKKPSSIRLDWLEPARDPDDPVPLLAHHALRPVAYTASGSSEYMHAQRHYNTLKRVSTNRAMTEGEKAESARLQSIIQQCRADSSQQRRECLVVVSARGFRATGLSADVTHHVLALLAHMQHVRLHCSLEVYEQRVGYVFRNRRVLELALTHPSYRSNFGTTCDHAKNALANCGIKGSKAGRHTEEGRRGERKKGMQNLNQIMSQPGSQDCQQSPIVHNERLEYLGDAVIELITTVHLYLLFPQLQEGPLATFRSALVQNKNLAALAKRLGVDEFMLFSHGPDLCHEANLRHAMANAFEAMFAAIFLDGGIDHCQRLFAQTMWSGEPEMLDTWLHPPVHRLKTGEDGVSSESDRHMIAEVACLQRLAEWEERVGVRFQHIRLLAKAFTRKNIPYNNLTFGNNQRLELLGDSVLQLATTVYLYKHFPRHHEGHLSLLRTCIVSNKTQSLICDDLDMCSYVIRAPHMRQQPTLRVKDKADLVEAFIGALFIDRGWDYCRAFCKVCFFPRLKYFISMSKWNDAKSELQQRCLSIRILDGSDPPVPEYRTIGMCGSSNSRVYRVAVYFRKKRLAEAEAATVATAQMMAAERALVECADLWSGEGKEGGQRKRKRGNRGAQQQQQPQQGQQQCIAPPPPPPQHALVRPPSLLSLQFQPQFPPPMFYQ